MKVLIATEGSKFSEAAIDKCCKMLEEAEDADLRIVTAVEPAYVMAAPFAMVPAYTNDLDTANREAAERTAEEAKAEILRRLPALEGEVSTKVALGAPQQVIVDEAESWGADLIIVGSHGYGFWERALLGSVSNSVVHHAPCSVLVVRPPKGNNGDVSH